MKDLVPKFKILVFIGHLSCLFKYIIGVCSCRNTNADTNNSNEKRFPLPC